MASQKPENNNPHAGHRDRLRDRLLLGGINDSTPDHEILEFLLMHTVPRRDVNAIAHRLTEVFGSLNGVMDASAEDLVSLGGITKNSAVLIKMIMPIARAYTARADKGKKEFGCIADIPPYILDLYMGYDKEVVSALFISRSGNLIKFDILGYGDADAVNLSVKSILDKALRYKASTVVLAHNHPGGVALPSMDDINLTKEVRLALSHLDIKLIDHVIISGNKYYSLALSDKFSKIF